MSEPGVYVPHLWQLLVASGTLIAGPFVGLAMEAAGADDLCAAMVMIALISCGCGMMVMLKMVCDWPGAQVEEAKRRWIKARKDWEEA